MLSDRLIPRTMAALHLFLVGLGAAHVRLPDGGALGTALGIYASASGASNSYSFFAPGVGAQLRVRVEGVTRDGRPFADDPEAGRNRELRLRIGNIVSKLWSDVSDPATRRAVVASLAAKALAARDDVDKVTVRLESFDLPTMDAYREGERGQWKTYYDATFAYSRQKP